jgi:hypothetical protein
MLVAVILAVLALAALGLMRAGPRRSRGDIPARIVAAAARQLPVRLQDWGQAMIAELPEIPDRAGRWRFAVGVVRVALFPPARHGRRVLVTALAGLAVAAGVTAAAAGQVPSLTVFAAALGLLLAGCATVATWRSAWAGWTARQVMVAAVAAAAVTAAITDVAWIAMFHPAAITASANVPLYSVVFAVLLAICLAVALSPPRGPRTAIVLGTGLAGALASGAAYAAAAVAGVTGGQLLAGPVAALTVAAAVSARTRSRPAGIRSGLLVGALTAPMRFAADLTALLRVRHYTLTDKYDIAAFPHSGYPTVASYLLSDALGGAILSGMLFTSLLLIAATVLGAAAGARPSRPDLLADRP